MRTATPIFKVPAKIYTHFALVTLAITFAVAMFADVEERKQVREDVIEREARKAKVNEQVNKVRNRQIASGLRHDRAAAYDHDDHDPADDISPIAPSMSMSGYNPEPVRAAVSPFAVKQQRPSAKELESSVPTALPQAASSATTEPPPLPR